MTDLKQRAGKFDSPESAPETDGLRRARGQQLPVAPMQDYSSEGTRTTPCRTRHSAHWNFPVMMSVTTAEEVIVETGYDSEADTGNPTGSVLWWRMVLDFTVPWDQVDDYMHPPRQFVPEEEKRYLTLAGSL